MNDYELSRIADKLKSIDGTLGFIAVLLLVLTINSCIALCSINSNIKAGVEKMPAAKELP